MLGEFGKMPTWIHFFVPPQSEIGLYINRLKDAILCLDAETAIEPEKSLRTVYSSTYLQG